VSLLDFVEGEIGDSEKPLSRRFVLGWDGDEGWFEVETVERVQIVIGGVCASIIVLDSACAGT